MRNLFIAAIAAFTVSGAANAASIDHVSIGANQTAASVTGTIAGLGVTLTGETVDDSLARIAAADVGYDGTGFGVDGVNGTSIITGARVDPSNGEASAYTIDGVVVDGGFAVNELLRLTFGQQVAVRSFTFALTDRIDDVTFVVDGDVSNAMRFGLGGDTSRNAGTIAETISFGSVQRGTTFDIIAGYPNQTCTVTGTRACGGASDVFQLVSADVAPVPVPAGGLLLLSGLGAAGALRARAKRR